MKVKYHRSTRPNHGACAAALAPAVVVHGMADARLALALGMGRPVTLLSAEAAACFAGAGWWQAMMRAARQEFPATPLDHVLDCADAAGVALEALRAGQSLIVLAECTAWRLVASRAAACGATVLARRPPALDLAAPGASRKLPAWLTPNRDTPEILG